MALLPVHLQRALSTIKDATKEEDDRERDRESGRKRRGGETGSLVCIG